MEEKVMHIASGQSVADDLISKGVCNVYAFNEAMCEVIQQKIFIVIHFVLKEQMRTAYRLMNTMIDMLT